ncbi:MAG: general secretion pathway protein GspF [Gammaproteobacteria bacterium]|nr:general secretion pathway protein GspF [Gammaproteobacteria bacterium]
MLKKPNRILLPDAPLYHQDHARPVTRREFIKQGFLTGSATLLTGGVFSLFANPNAAMAAVAGDLDALASEIGCVLGGGADGEKVPFICFDLAGGASVAGSNVLIGQNDGQRDYLSSAGYSKQGIPGDMVPGGISEGVDLLNLSSAKDFVNDELNLLFHADSALLKGILEKAGGALGNIDGCVIPARSENDTDINTHNPLYGISMAGASGTVVDLIGSSSTESGGKSVAPASQINPEVRPTKVDRPSDVTGLVDVSNLTAILSDPNDVTAVMESIARLSHKKMSLNDISTGLTKDKVIKDLVRCGYLKAADIAERFAGESIDPTQDDHIKEIFSTTEFSDTEFSKTASVMKMVLRGYAGGGCITMSGYDYHTGNRIVGENRDLRAGRCIGACLNYAQRLNKPLMIYVFSDGSVSSNGSRDESDSFGDTESETLILGGRGKGVWTGDSSATAASFVLVYSPTAAPTLVGSRQIGSMNTIGSVVTSSSPAANNPNLLVNMLLLNYMAINGDIAKGGSMANFTNIFGSHGLGGNLEDYIAFGAL